MGFIDDLLTGKSKIVFVAGKGQLEDNKGKLIAYPTWSGELCDRTGEPIAVFQDFKRDTYSLYSPAEAYLGSGNFSGIFIDADENEHFIPALGKLANKAKKLYNSTIS